MQDFQTLDDWVPKTELGQKVNSGEISDIEEVFNLGYKIQEPEVVEKLIPELQSELLLIGQAKGKFGGGQRRIFRQTQKKTEDGNNISFTTCAVVGNGDGYVGVALGKSRETHPAREKSVRKAKLNLMKIRRGAGSWGSDSLEPTSIPFAVEGRCGSVRIKLMPAPKGKGLCVEKECAKILKVAGIKDIWSKTSGQTGTKINLIKALVNALEKLSEVRTTEKFASKVGLIEGKFRGEQQ